MVENQMPQNEITILDLFKIVLKKIKLIAWITLIALLLGAAGGAALAIISNATYGTQVDFYIYSEESNSYILSLLRSDSFAESLLLDENGLPTDKQGTKEYKEALELKEQLDIKRDEIEDLEKEIKLYPAKTAKLQRDYNDAQTAYDDLTKRLNTYMGIQVDGLLNANDSEIRNKIATLEKALDGINNEKEGEVDTKIARDQAKAAYNAILDKTQEAQELLLEAQYDLAELNSDKRAAFDKVLIDFRKNEENIKTTQTIKKSLSFEYEKTDKDNKIDESKAHLYVNIAVKFDKVLAQDLLEKVTSSLSRFVEDSVIAEGEERETECTLLSVLGSVGSVDYKNPLIEAAKFGGIAAAAAFIITAFVVIVIDRIKATDVAKIEAPADKPAIEEPKENEEE